MTWRTTWILALVVLLLGSVLYIMDQRQQPGQGGQADTRVFDLTTEPVSLVGFVRGEDWFEVARKEENWFLQAPIRARANGLMMNRIVATLERLRALDRITAEQRALRNLTLADYGLEQEDVLLSVESGDRRETLVIGNRTPFGGGVYARKRGSETIWILPEEFLALLPPDSSALRERTLFQGAARRVTRVDIHRRDAGFVQLTRRQGRWYLLQPVEWPASQSAVQELLHTLLEAEVGQFLWDARVDQPEEVSEVALRSQLESGRLASDQAPVRLTLWFEEGGTGQELFLGQRLGSEANELYGRRSGIPSVFTVPADLFTLAMTPVEQLRDRRIADFPPEQIRSVSLAWGERRIALERRGNGDWLLQEPVRAPVAGETLQRLLRELSELRVHSFTGPEKQAEGTELLSIILRAGEEGRERVPLLFLSLDPSVDSSGRWSGWIEGWDDGFLLDGFPMGHDVQALFDPTQYRSRVVLSIPRRSLILVQQRSGSGTVTLERSGESAGVESWSCVLPATGQPDREGLALLLQMLERLEARDVVAFDPPDLQAFGLVEPDQVLTFRFADEERIQQRFLLGKRTDQGGQYAMLQGHGFVFLLGREEARVLTGSWILTDPVPEAAAEEEQLEEEQHAPATVGEVPVAAEEEAEPEEVPDSAPPAVLETREPRPENKDRPEGESAVVAALRARALPVEDASDLDPLVERAETRRLVLLGESTHGTAAFYAWRAKISQRLIAEKGYRFVAVEGDWAAIYRLNRYVQDLPGSEEDPRMIMQGFRRWPEWMWANEETLAFVEWLRAWNEALPADERVGFYGMDVYGDDDALHAMLEKLDGLDPELAADARELYAPYLPFAGNGRAYAMALQQGAPFFGPTAERGHTLLAERTTSLLAENPLARLNLLQKAHVVRRAEKHYRAMLIPDLHSWNARADHFFETVARLLAHYGEQSRGIVWAHNTHIGDARATPMRADGSRNIGQTAREVLGGENVLAVGLGAYQGHVLAGRNWGGRREKMVLPAGGAGSYEAIFEAVGFPIALFLLEGAQEEPDLMQVRGHRAVGVLYHPEREFPGNYVPTLLPLRYDAFLFFRDTDALTVIE